MPSIKRGINSVIFHGLQEHSKDTIIEQIPKINTT